MVVNGLDSLNVDVRRHAIRHGVDHSEFNQVVMGNRCML
jgi:hypothetical protein